VFARQINICRSATGCNEQNRAGSQFGSHSPRRRRPHPKRLERPPAGEVHSGPAGPRGTAHPSSS